MAEFIFDVLNGVKMNKNLKGTIMVLMAGIAWGISGISGQYLMAHGMNINLLTSVRLMVSGILLTAMAVISQPQHFFRAVKHSRKFLVVSLCLLLLGF